MLTRFLLKFSMIF